MNLDKLKSRDPLTDRRVRNGGSPEEADSSRISESTLPKVAFCLALIVAGFAYGYVSHRFGLPPQELVAMAMQGVRELRQRWSDELPWYYLHTDRTESVIVHDAKAVAPGLTLFAGIGKEGELFARIVDRDGQTINAWSLDWFDVWPDANHLPDDVVPKSPPGTCIQGIVPLEDGGLVFNFEELGMVRVDAAGRVVWRLAYRTHHSLVRDDEGNFWAPGMRTHEKAKPEFPLYAPPFQEFTLVKVSSDGRLLEEHSVFELLRRNGLMGLLYLGSRDDWQPDMSGDTLHLNDLKVFSARLRPGVLQAGDVMISLRNINAVLIFRQSDWRVKYLSIGKVIRQHDPDFLDGNTISIFDNRPLGDRGDGAQSRIVVEDLRDGTSKVIFEGSKENPFYTDIMGKHQTLSNGNLLLLEARAGRIWEVDANGRLVWELNNIIEPGLMAVVSDVIRLPADATGVIRGSRLTGVRRNSSAPPPANATD